MRAALLVLLVAMLAAERALAYPPFPNTPLDDYVNAPNPTFKWQLVNSIKKFDFTVYNIFLTSQTWLTANDTSNPVWTHWLQVCIPDALMLNEGTAFMYMDGGHTPNIASPPTDVDPYSTAVCGINQMVAAHLSAIPNEPMVFYDDPTRKSRSEDAIIAWTWYHYLQCVAEPYWLARMPMTLAGVTAMTAIEQFTASFTDIVPIKTFIVSGASKRGWTTWTVGAVDPRVIAIVPMVAPIANLVPQINEMWMAYGSWSFALEDYTALNLMEYLNAPVFQDMLQIIAPDGYYERLTMPKFIIVDVADEFFMPDAVRWFWEYLPEPKVNRLLANAEHSMSGHQIDMYLSCVSGFVVDVIKQRSFPNLIWTISPDGTNITAQVVANTNQSLVPPKKAIMWYYNNPATRDFRWIRCADIENPQCLHPYLMSFVELTDIGDYTYVASQPVPQAGWTIFFIEVEFSDTGGMNELDPLKITTVPSIIPQTYPYASCGSACDLPNPAQNCSIF